jgi:hydroxymethylbilane synthase
LRELLAQTVHRPTWLAAHAERAVSRALGGSCSMPLAAHATWEGGTLHLEAALGHAQQPTLSLLRFTVEGAPADEASARRLGEEAAQGLRLAGASGYLGAA